MYKVDHKSRIFFRVINESVVNEWLLYRRHSSQKLVPTKEQLDLIEFTAIISQSPIFHNKLHSHFSRKQGRLSVYNVHTDKCLREKSNSPKKRFATLHTSDETRYNNVGHYPIHAEPKQRCRACHSYVRIKCIKYNYHLCVTKNKNCFIEFHSL